METTATLRKLRISRDNGSNCSDDTLIIEMDVAVSRFSNSSTF